MTDKSFPKIKNISAIDQAMLDRLVIDPHSTSKGGVPRINPSAVAQIFKRTARETNDIRNIFKVMPWLHLSREILISSITAPGDLIQCVLSFTNKMKGVQPALTAQLDKVLKDAFVDEQDMESKVYEWVDEGMIMGSHPIMIIPESSLDKMLNAQMSNEAVATYGEEFSNGWYKPKGLLGVPAKTTSDVQYVSFESFSAKRIDVELVDLHTIKGKTTTGKAVKTVPLPIRVTDNLAIFRKPVVDKAMRSRNFTHAYGETAFESLSKKMDAAAIQKRFFKRPKLSSRERLEIISVTKTDEIKGLGHPMVYHLPPESVIPIYIPGDVTNHPWYIVLNDFNGYPVSFVRQSSYYDDVRGHLTNNGSESQASGDIIQMAKEALGGSISEVSNADIDRLTQMNSEIIESDIVNRIRAGIAGGEVTFTMPEHIKRMMYARVLANKQTTMVLVPADYMVYIAYDYNEFGVGKSILEDAKGLAAQAAAVHVANILGAIQNAIPGKDINITLEPDDENPVEAVTYMASEALGLAYRQFPMHVSTTAGLTEQLQLSAFNINVSGNPRYPEVSSTITPRESTQVVIDPELKSQLKDDLNSVFGLTPEMVDNINQPDFATTAVNNSLLLLKRVMNGQAKTNPFLTDYVRIFTYNSGILLTRLLDVVENNKKHIPKEYSNPLEFVEDYINSVHVALPKPQTENLIKQAELLEKMEQAMDKILDANFKQEFLAGFDNPALEEAYPVLRESFKGLLLRKWMREHGIFRDLDVFGTSDEGSPLADLSAEMMTHTEVLRETIGDFYKKVANYVDRNKKKVADIVAKGEKAKTPDDVPVGDDVGDEDLALSDEELDNPPSDNDLGDLPPEEPEEPEEV